MASKLWVIEILEGERKGLRVEQEAYSARNAVHAAILRGVLPVAHYTDTPVQVWGTHAPRQRHNLTARWAPTVSVVRAAWLKARMEGLGGSDLAALFGVSPFRDTTPRALWEVKTGRRPAFAGNAATDRGSRLEPFVCAEAARRLGVTLGLGVEMQRHARWGEGVRLFANTDRTLPSGVFEAKTARQDSDTARTFLGGAIPVYYALQLQCYAEVLGAPGGVIACLIGDGATWETPERCALVLRVWMGLPSLGAVLAEVAQDWWTTHVVGDVPPDYSLHPRWPEVEAMLNVPWHFAPRPKPTAAAPSLEVPMNPKFPIKRAVRQALRARIALDGPTGSGKTYTALQFALGLGERVVVIDTEHERSQLYAALGAFDVMTLPDHAPQTFTEAIQEAEAQGYDVIVLDSLSHAWMGREGALEQVDRRAARSKGNSFTAWRDVTPAHNALVDAMIRSRAHLIATLRTKTAYEVVEDERGKKAPQKIGLQPIQREGIEYEFDLILDLDADHLARVVKTRYLGLDLDGKALLKPDRSLGQRIRLYLDSGEPLHPRSTPTVVGVAPEALTPPATPPPAPAPHERLQLAVKAARTSLKLNREDAIAFGRAACRRFGAERSADLSAEAADEAASWLEGVSVDELKGWRSWDAPAPAPSHRDRGREGKAGLPALWQRTSDAVHAVINEIILNSTDPLNLPERHRLHDELKRIVHRACRLESTLDPEASDWQLVHLDVLEQMARSLRSVRDTVPPGEQFNAAHEHCEILITGRRDAAA